jgi:hypothetical protein
MCQANGKEWSNYKRLKTTTEYWQGLEADIGITISALILEIKGGGDGSGSTEQSTWVHPEVAVDLGQWVSTPFRIWVNRTITRFMVHQQQFLQPVAAKARQAIARLQPYWRKISCNQSFS